MASKRQEMLTTAQVAAAVGVHEETVRRWIVGGALPAEYPLKKPGGVRRVYRIDSKYVDIILSGRWAEYLKELKREAR